MNDLELLELAMNSLSHRSLRSWLAILGIVIGVASIVSLISISTGMNQNIQKSLGGLGANVITITAGASRAGSMGFGGGGAPQDFGRATTSTAKITFNEADALKTVAGVSKVDARVQGSGKITYANKNTSATVIGVDPSAFPASSVSTIYLGRTLGTGDLTSVVIGYSVMTDTFNDSGILNKQIKINGQPFRVIGVLNQSSTTFGGPDRNLFITQKAAKTLFNQTDKVSSVVVIAQNGTDPATVAAALSAKLQALHRVTNSTQDFTVTTAASTASTISSVTDTLGIFLGGIASISLIVGGIGVANAMFTSVLEQTRYIGLLKALGARNGTILKLFLYEACMVGMIGGVLGIALSYLASSALASFGLPSAITLDLVLLGMGFSVIVGAVAGVIPARNASSVAPVEALRYE